LPLIIIQYGVQLARDVAPPIMGVVVFGGLAAALVRLALEPFMVGCIGLALGAAWPRRWVSGGAALALSAAYFGLINLLRLMPMALPLRVVVEIILPVVLPVIISLAALRMTQWLIEKD
jgi:hypothetical protein